MKDPISDSQSKPTDKVCVSVGVCAYNEEANIHNLLSALLSQESRRVEIGEIIVVSSACTDRTNEIVRSFEARSPHVALIEQPRREGKVSAINLFLQRAKHGLCVLISADTIPFPDAVEAIALPLLDEGVGMVGGHPIPVNDRSSFMGFVSHLIWDLAHKVSLSGPKPGEFVAFRNVIGEVPFNSAVDEATIEAMVRQQGYTVVYAPTACIHNKGPETIGDFVKQRRRIFAGHLHLKKTTGYEVSSLSSLRVLRLVLEDVRLRPRSVMWTLGASLLEGYARLLGCYDFYFKKNNHFIWDISPSTKELVHGRNSTTNPPI